MSLRSFLEEMERKGEVIHIRDQVSPRLEVSSIMKAFNGGPILFFDQVEDYATKIVANVCGTRQRLCSALKVSPEGLYQRLVETQLSPVTPKIVKEGPLSLIHI